MIRQRAARRALTGALSSAFVLALSACVSMAPLRAPADRAAELAHALDEAGSWPERRALLLAQQSFALQGRVAVAAAADGFSGLLRWSQQGSAGDMQLSGPLGVGALAVTFDETTLRVSNSRGETLSGAAARAELERNLGFELPLRQLGYWVRGVSAPAPEIASGSEALDKAGMRLAALEQDGWHVDYSAYAPSSLGVLPQKLQLQRGVVRIRLAIQSWQLP